MLNAMYGDQQETSRVSKISGFRKMRSAKVEALREMSDSIHTQMSNSSFSTKHAHRASKMSPTIAIEQNEYTNEEIKEYKQIFSMFDTDGSGAIGKKELKEAMIRIGLKTNEDDIENLIKQIDADGNGEIDFSEFCACIKQTQNLTKSTNDELAQICFHVFDRDGNGIITENEFVYVAKEVGGFSDQLAEYVFGQLDTCSNGHLTLAQFGAIVEDYLGEASSTDETMKKSFEQINSDTQLTSL